MYQKYPKSSHEVLVNNYFESIGGQQGLSDVYSDKSLLLCFTNRCGSTLLASKLSELGLFGQPSDYNNYEFFNGDEVVDYCKKNNIKSLVKYLGALISNYSSKLGYFSSKVSIDQLVWLTKNNLLKTKIKNTQFIFCYRKDVISQAVSLSIAMQTGKWTSNHAGRNVELIYSEQEITNYIFMIKRANALFDVFFAQHNIKPIKISYESMLEDKNIVANELKCRGIDFVKQINPTFKTEKQARNINAEWRELYLTKYKQRLSSDF